MNYSQINDAKIEQTGLFRLRIPHMSEAHSCIDNGPHGVQYNARFEYAKQLRWYAFQGTLLCLQ